VITLRSPLARRAVLFGGPLLFYVGALIHPKLKAGDTWFLALHLTFPFLICLLAWGLLLLVDGVDNPAASLTRVLAIPFAVVYTTYTAFGGIAVGAFAWKVESLPEQAQPIGVQLVNSVTGSALDRPLYLAAGISWVAAVGAVVLALRRSAPWPGLVLILVGAVLFAKSHVRPWGPAGMAAFLAGVVWLELRTARSGSTAEVGALTRDLPASRTGR
jgi:hypothetical protein